MVRTRLTSFPRQIMICLSFSLMAILFPQVVYSQSSFGSNHTNYRQVIKSEGIYDLAGKKLFIQNKIEESDNKAQTVAFDNYLRQSLIMRGAVPVSESVDADFIVRSSVQIGRHSKDVSFSSGKSKVGGKGTKADSWKMYRDTVSYDWTERDKRYMEKGLLGNNSKHYEIFNRKIVVEIVDPKSMDLLGRTEINSYNNGLGFEALSPNEAMLFAAADSYGKNVKEVVSLDVDNGYLTQFKEENAKFNYAPKSVSSSEKVSLFLVDRRADKTVVIVKDNGKMRLNTDKKQPAAYLRVGNSLLPCSNISYNTDNWRETRLLKMEFPSIADNKKTIDVLICKPGKPDKIKYSVSGISL
ncbi:MAG: hypothetical protein IKZ50_05445 [Bacteroidales bacterium]|nr:hypothetical protein [Bacteroidales bacterium]